MTVSRLLVRVPKRDRTTRINVDAKGISLHEMVYAVHQWLFYIIEIENLVVTQFIHRIPQQLHSGMEDPEILENHWPSVHGESPKLSSNISGGIWQHQCRWTRQQEWMRAGKKQNAFFFRLLYMDITLRLSLPSLNNPTKEKSFSGVPLGGFQTQSVYCTEETGS